LTLNKLFCNFHLKDLPKDKPHFIPFLVFSKSGRKDTGHAYSFQMIWKKIWLKRPNHNTGAEK
jgi:hypothetical protein